MEVLYERGFGAMAVFTTAALFGNVVMLNLLIAIVRPCKDAAPLPALQRGPCAERPIVLQI